MKIQSHSHHTTHALPKPRPHHRQFPETRSGLSFQPIIGLDRLGQSAVSRIFKKFSIPADRRALAPGPPPRRAHPSLPSSAPSGHTTARLQTGCNLDCSKSNSPPSRSAVRHCAGSARPSQDSLKKVGSKPNARPATHSPRVLPQRRESAQFNSQNSEATTRVQNADSCQQPTTPSTAPCAASCIYAPSPGRPSTFSTPSPLHRLLGATATRHTSPGAPIARACHPCESGLAKRHSRVKHVASAQSAQL